jgi:hypothetical protein
MIGGGERSSLFNGSLLSAVAIWERRVSFAGEAEPFSCEEPETASGGGSFFELAPSVLAGLEAAELTVWFNEGWSEL